MKATKMASNTTYTFISHCPDATYVLPFSFRMFIMHLIGATYIRASKLLSDASYVGWPDLTEFEFRPRLTFNTLHELQYNVQVNNTSLPPNLWDFYPTRSHESGSCLVTSSSAMEALGSPSISRAPMGGGHAFRIPKTSVCR